MHLSPEEIAAAEACGVSFLPASDAQVQRLAMQRKVFYRAGAPILATRGDGLFETVGTLKQLIEEGRAQQRDLSQWLEAAESGAAAVLEVLPEAVPEVPPPEAPPKVAPEPEAAMAAPVEPASLPEPVAAAEPAPPPKRPRQKRRRPEVVTPELVVPGLAAPEPAAEEPVAEDTVEVEPPQEMEAELAESAVVPLPPVLSRSLGRTAARAPAATAETPGQDRGKRWLMAGAARRGRAGKHWSTRQR